MFLTLLPDFGTYSSCQSASSNLGGGVGAWSHCSLRYHGWLISIGCRPVPEEKQWRRKGWGREGGGEGAGKREGGELGRGEGGKALVRMQK